MKSLRFPKNLDNRVCYIELYEAHKSWHNDTTYKQALINHVSTVFFKFHSEEETRFTMMNEKLDE